MKSETEWTLERIKLYELMQQHPDWSYRAYARELGHDPSWVQKWYRRIKTAKPLNIDTFKSQSRAPKNPPHKISTEAKQLVVELTKELSEKYHRKAGAKTIQYGLEQRQKSQPLPFKVPKSASSINKILRETGHIQPPKPRLREPVNLPAPMEEWEMDFGEIYPAEDGVFEFFIVVDRGTSRLMYLEGGQGYCAETALESVARLLLIHGTPKRIRFDRDVRLWGAWTRDSYPSPLIRFLRVLSGYSKVDNEGVILEVRVDE